MAGALPRHAGQPDRKLCVT
ncbi:hypothetical protein ACFO32_001496 [Salmonella enterica]